MSDDEVKAIQEDNHYFMDNERMNDDDVSLYLRVIVSCVAALMVLVTFEFWEWIE